MFSPTNRGKRIYPGAPNLDDVCRCGGPVSEEDLHYDWPEIEFENEPCPYCGRRVMCGPPPVWMTEEEDDC